MERAAGVARLPPAPPAPAAAAAGSALHVEPPPRAVEEHPPGPAGRPLSGGVHCRARYSGGAPAHPSPAPTADRGPARGAPRLRALCPGGRGARGPHGSSRRATDLPVLLLVQTLPAAGPVPRRGRPYPRPPTGGASRSHASRRAGGRSAALPLRADIPHPWLGERLAARHACLGIVI